MHNLLNEEKGKERRKKKREEAYRLLSPQPPPFCQFLLVHVASHSLLHESYYSNNTHTPFSSAHCPFFYSESQHQTLQRRRRPPSPATTINNFQTSRRRRPFTSFFPLSIEALCCLIPFLLFFKSPVFLFPRFSSPAAL